MEGRREGGRERGSGEGGGKKGERGKEYIKFFHLWPYEESLFTVHVPYTHVSLQVAERKADLYLHTTAIKKWDICAGNAVLNTLGGKMTTRRGERIDYSLDGDPKNSDGIIATATEKEHADYLSKLRI